MKRWHQEVMHMMRQVKFHQLRVGENSRWSALGRFRKRKDLDCGHSKCYCCHYYKYPKRAKTKRELFAELNLSEQLDEIKRPYCGSKITRPRRV